MRTQSLFALAALSVLIPSTAIAQDEYDYIDTPVADQIADLQDDDRDGVINARDVCPGTPEAASVDNDGCGASISDSDERQLLVLFAHDSYEINPIFSDQIQSMADFLKIYQSASIQIQGFASKIGTDEYNLELSKQRAIAVEQELLSYQIAPERVSIIGYGESRLESDGDDEASHAVNRKVAATVVGLKEEVVEEWTIFTVIEK